MIDAHAHLITRSIVERAFGKEPMESDKYGEFKKLNHFTADDLRKEWEKAVEENRLEKVVFMAMKPGIREFNSIIKSSSRLEGFTSFDPHQQGSLELTLKDLEEGMKGVKLYPSMRAFSVADKSLYPLYEHCAANSLPVAVHFGVTIGPRADLRYGNPLDLSPVLGDFPSIPFVVAHFGAGFFRESLMIAYKRDNLFLDTSGTNNWLCYQPGGLSLSDIFRQAVKSLGPEKIIFGTDSRLIIDSYRTKILRQQRRILNDLLKPADVELVMEGNARRVYNLEI